LLSAFVLISASALTACTDQNDRKARNDLGQVDNDPVTRENYSAPGTLGGFEKERGSTDVKIQKEVIRRETDTESESIPTVDEKHVKADVNRLSQEEFVKLGLSEKVAKNVIRYRDKNGKFGSVDQFGQVPGMDTAWFNKMKNQLGASTG